MHDQKRQKKEQCAASEARIILKCLNGKKEIRSIDMNDFINYGMQGNATTEPTSTSASALRSQSTHPEFPLPIELGRNDGRFPAIKPTESLLADRMVRLIDGDRAAKKRLKK